MPAHSALIEQSVRKCEELTSTFNQRDIFSNDVNLTRARTLAIAADSGHNGGQRRKFTSPIPHPTLSHSAITAKSTSLQQSVGGTLVNPGEKPTTSSKLSFGLQTLQNRLLEVEEASATAQARGSSVDVELSKLRAQVGERDTIGAGAPSPVAPSSHRRSTKGGTAKMPAGAAPSSNHLRHAAGGGVSAVNAQARKHGQHHGGSTSPALYPSSETPVALRDSSDGSSRRPYDDHSSQPAGSRLSDYVQTMGKVPAAVERARLAPSEWFQKSTEHLEYPEAEKETRQHFKKRDEAKRGVTPVERYTVPFSTKMTEKERAWQDGSAKVSISIIHPDPLAALRKTSHAKPSTDTGDDDPPAPRVVVATSGKTRISDPRDRAESPIQKKQRPPPPAAGKGLVGKRPAALASPMGDDNDDVFEKMQDRNQFIRLARSSRKARKVYESSIAKELLAAANMLGPHVPLFANQPRKQKRSNPHLDNGSGDESSFLNRVDQHDDDDDDAQSNLSYSSSDSEEVGEDAHMEAEREGIRHLGDDDSAAQIPGVRGFTSDERTNDLQDTCDLVECCVVCLCQQLGGSRSAITREQVILRSILIHALYSALPPLEDELSRRLAFINKKVSVPPAQRRTDAALISRLLRSWVKGCEVLLTLDMGTINDEGIPFSIHNEGHLTRMIQNYCRLHEGKDDRVQRLFERWRANKEEADSAIIRNDTAKLLKPPPPQQTKAMDIVSHFRNLASVTTDDLALLDHQAATVTAKQRDLAQVFLDRLTKFLPLPDESKTIAQRRVEQVAEITEDDLMLRHEPPNLKHVLLHYTGLIRHAQHLSAVAPGAAAASAQLPSTGVSVQSQHLLATPATVDASLRNDQSTSFSFGAANVSTAGVTKFLNVFRTSWGRTPLTGDVEESEAADRAATMQNNTMIMLFDAYFRLLSPVLQERVKLLVRDEKKRSAELRAKMKADAEAFHRALDEIGHVVKEDPMMGARKEALHQVERYQLIDKYTVSKIDPTTADKLRKSIENSEEWFGYEQSRRAARVAAANPQNEEWNNNDDAPSTGASEKPAGNTRGSPSGGNTRMEMIRIRKLQELEVCWQKLNIGYSLRVTLHDKWNHPTKELRHIDAALKLYRECIAAVEVREAAVEKVLSNEKNSDKSERNTNRNELFSAMCSAGQRCELVAKKLFNDSGDELYVKSDMYLAKIRDDFARISKMIRTAS